MPQYLRDHVFILPHATAYRRLYAVSVEQVLQTLNEPDLAEGLAQDHYTAEKDFAGQRVYVYYYLTLPLQGSRDEAYIIVDFIAQLADEHARESPHKSGSAGRTATKEYAKT